MLNAFTIDVEEWFHICEAQPPVSEWSRLESRLERNVEHLLQLLSDTGVHCTCFLLGWTVERHPAVVKRIAEAGHEIATHGYTHQRVDELQPAQFRADLERAIGATERVLGIRPAGYRAPAFSISDITPWALETVADFELNFDSSLVAGKPSQQGLSGANLGPHRISLPSGRSLLEFPISTTRILGRHIRYCGGGYLRLFPFIFIKSRIERSLADGLPVMAYVHPRDIDPGQPRLPMSVKQRFKSYVGLASASSKLKRLLSTFRFGTVSEALVEWNGRWSEGFEEEGAQRARRQQPGEEAPPDQAAMSSRRG